MLATYMTDTWLTPPVLAARYPKYKSIHGTDAKIFEDTPPEMGFFVEKRGFDHREIYKALEEGMAGGHGGMDELMLRSFFDAVQSGRSVRIS